MTGKTKIPEINLPSEIVIIIKPLKFIFYFLLLYKKNIRKIKKIKKYSVFLSTKKALAEILHKSFFLLTLQSNQNHTNMACLFYLAMPDIPSQL